MKYGITLLGNRVAPRYTYADSIMLITQRRNNISSKKELLIHNHSFQSLCEMLFQNCVDILVCGGITREDKNILNDHKMDIIDNVACTIDDLILALKSGKLKQGFRLNSAKAINSIKPQKEASSINEKEDDINCLTCIDKVCLQGKSCHPSISELSRHEVPDSELMHMLEAATDIACENERTLCRLSELIYFCLEMQYKRIGIAYCVDLQEPTEILVRVLERFFDVFPICCKVGGIAQYNPLKMELESSEKNTTNNISCNPWGQAQVLNKLNTDINVMVGICMGADCIFTEGSQAPTTALFIKDKSLANNPIGAVYSDYYLKEAFTTRTKKMKI